MARKSPARPKKAAPVVWRVVIPQWYPVSYNAVRGRHWKAEYKAKKGTVEIVGVYAALSGVPRLLNRQVKRRVTLSVTIGGGRTLPDPDNLNKIFRDALKLCSLIVDDSCEWLEMPEPIVMGGNPTETVITFEDLP